MNDLEVIRVIHGAHNERIIDMFSCLVCCSHVMRRPTELTKLTAVTQVALVPSLAALLLLIF